MSIVEKFYTGLQGALPQQSLDELALGVGATPDQLSELQAAYPQCPPALQQLLGKINGTHWQAYEKGEIAVLMLGSDMVEYPYYLRSVAQILQERREHAQSIADAYGDDFLESPEMADKRVDPEVPMAERLCFSHCMNNGETSKLYLDFNPRANGTVGQVVRFLQNPDEYVVIADSFESYLQMLIEDKYNFVIEE